MTKSSSQEKERFLTTLTEQVALMNARLDSLPIAGWSEQELNRFNQQLQGLAGTCSRFGLLELNRIMGYIQHHITEILTKGASKSGAAVTACHSQIPELKRAVAAALTKPGIAHQSDRTVFLLFSRNDVAPGLEELLRAQRCNVFRFNRSDDVLGEITRQLPDAIVLEGEFVPDLPLMNRELALQQSQHGKKVHLICINRQRDIEQRIAALRCGVDKYYLHPVKSTELCEQITTLIRPDSVQHRVLIVDDDSTQADFAARILKRAGMLTETVLKPLKVLEALQRFQPDLVLMDLYMPRVNGMELTSIIREHPAFVKVPIVFLSGEQNPDKQLDALSTGGDDFLSKPIQPEHLVSKVSHRILRARVIERGNEQPLHASPIDYTSDAEPPSPAAEAAGQEHSKPPPFQVSYHPVRIFDHPDLNAYYLSIKDNAGADKNDAWLERDQYGIDCALTTIGEKRAEGEQLLLFIQPTPDQTWNSALIHWLREQLRKRQLSPEGLIFCYPAIELTQNLKGVREYFNRLRELGVAVALSGVQQGPGATKIANYLKPDYIELADTAPTRQDQGLSDTGLQITRLGVTLFTMA